jgi:hypothetical protein
MGWFIIVLQTLGFFVLLLNCLIHWSLMPLENRAQLNPKSPWFPWVLQAALTKNARGFVGCAHCRHL